MEHSVSAQCILLLKISAKYFFIGQHKVISAYFYALDTIYSFGGSPVTAVLGVHQKWACFLAACSYSLEGMVDLIVLFVLLHVITRVCCYWWYSVHTDGYLNTRAILTYKRS